jgi:hypothetical protein
MPQDHIVSMIRGIFKEVTITTAHKKYCTPRFQEKYGVPLHLLSVWISPEKYVRTAFSDKKDLILFSPDNVDLTLEIIKLIKTNLPQFETRIINGLTYEQYKDLIKEAKFVLTTGEGLDAYFIETYFSGGISMAIRNFSFFDEKYLNLPCLFDDDANLSTLFPKLLREYCDREKYEVLNNVVFELLADDYSYSTYQDNLTAFYNRYYTYA